MEGQILLWIQEFLRNPVLDNIVVAITHLGDTAVIWIVLTVVLLAFKKTRGIGMATALALLFSLLITNILLKNLVARIRPYEIVEGLTILISKQVDYSFPSGHTSSSVAAALAIWRNAPRKYGIAAIVLAMLISLSRLYVGVHYPTDVLGGVAAGILLMWLADRGMRLLKKILSLSKNNPFHLLYNYKLTWYNVLKQ